jgi:hypothetical protein
MSDHLPGTYDTLARMSRNAKSPPPKPAKSRGSTRSAKFLRLKDDLTGDPLIAAMQASPHRDIDLEPRRTPMPVREAKVPD